MRLITAYVRSSPRERGPRAKDWLEASASWIPGISAFTRVFDALCAGMSGGLRVRLKGGDGPCR
jgi:hypothetical protein